MSEQLKKILACRACLVTDTNLYNITSKSLIDTFRLLSESPSNDESDDPLSNKFEDAPIYLCSLCGYQVIKITEFCEKINTSQMILHQICDDETKFTTEFISTVDRDHYVLKPNLVITPPHIEDTIPRASVARPPKNKLTHSRTQKSSLLELKEAPKKQNKCAKTVNCANSKTVIPKKSRFLSKYSFKPVTLTKHQILREMCRQKSLTSFVKLTHKCTECIKGFDTEEQLQNHIALSHDPSLGSVVCEYCKMRMKTAAQLSVHMYMHTRRFKCNVCSFITKHRASVRIHHKTHDDKVQACPKCNKKFMNQPSFLKHLREHTNYNCFCDVCGLIFDSKTDLVLHRLDTHSDCSPKHACELCAAPFSTVFALIEHNKVSCYNICCVNCGSGFKSEGQLINHLRVVHSGLPPIEKHDGQLDVLGEVSVDENSRNKDTSQSDNNNELDDSGSNENRRATETLDKPERDELNNFNSDPIEIVDLTFDDQVNTVEVSTNETGVDLESVEEDIDSNILHKAIKFAKKYDMSLSKLPDGQERKDMELRKALFMKSTHRYGCGECYRIFDSEQFLQKHFRANHDPILGDHVCEYCNKRFKTSASLGVHMVTHKYVYNCTLCGFKTKIHLSMMTHYRSHRKEYLQVQNFSKDEINAQNNTTWCEFCGKILKNEVGLTNHKYLMHYDLDVSNTCGNCQLGFLNEKALKVHNSVECAPYACTHCGKGFKKATDLIKHLGETHRSVMYKPAVCDMCTNEFQDKRALVRHLGLSDGVCIGLHSCVQCGANFHEADKLHTHIVDIHMDKRYRCNLCEKTYTTAHLFYRHFDCNHSTRAEARRETQGSSPPTQTWDVSMDDGGISKTEAPDSRNTESAQIANIDYEISKIYWYRCAVCQEICRNKRLFMKHMKRHGEKPYKCDRCPKSFSRASFLQNHMRIHTGERPHKCETCGKGFRSACGLMRHVLIHSGKKSHVCDLCYKAFRTSNLMKNHIKTVHMKIRRAPRPPTRNKKTADN